MWPWCEKFISILGFYNLQKYQMSVYLQLKDDSHVIPHIVFKSTLKGIMMS